MYLLDMLVILSYSKTSDLYILSSAHYINEIIAAFKGTLTPL